ncbi:MAG: putative DNA binding domain-containing protein [Lachnospiraceae bacterium]|nr:putative DNA binding domain-containing protein [Lachnospiraceae bacterium]
MDAGSKINSLLTLEYMQREHENKYFDRKSARIRVAELAPLISAFANADGGTIVLGISDKKRTLEGINSIGEERINDFINAPKDLCKPMPRYQEEYVDITNDEGNPDRLLLLHIMSSDRQIVRTNNDETWLRIGDRTRQMLGDNLRNLEYDKGARNFEDEVCPYAKVDDLDPELLNRYKERIGATGLDDRQVLRARGFLLDHDRAEQLTNAAVLLFAKNELQFPLNCRIRFIRIDGCEMHVGADYNVVKDKSIDEPILRLIDVAKAYIADQLREFTHQDRVSGRFIETPEYPEFPWYEGIINAVAHREWAATGQFIKVSMYDDRLEIESPGRFPDIVTSDNISYTRFSRNKRISRVMTEFEWVRELNEGVKKIYSDMAEAGLPEPEYIEGPNTVRLILRNNIDERMPHRNKVRDHVPGEGLNDHLPENICEQLDDVEMGILTFIKKNGSTCRSQLEQYTHKSRGTVIKRLNKLMMKGLIKVNGGAHDPTRTYELVR